jgi:S-adenosylmethionine decarboxylase
LNALGTHLLIELRQCDRRYLDDLDYVRETMIAAAQVMDAQIIGESFHRFNPQGITGVLAIAESHLSIHTWPELDYAAADIFTCGPSFQPQGAAQLIIDRLKSKDPSMQIIRRGIEAPTPATRS